MNPNKTTKGNLKDFKINVKIKLSALWASVTLCMLYGDYFELYVPNKVAGLISGVNILDSPVKLFAASVLLAIPSVMVFLSILLKPKANRILNLLFGFLFAAMMLLIALTSMVPWRMFYVFLAFLESFITILIIGYAWKWPKKQTD
ncbi:DUF6326 family protein [Aequorivita antarctica]|uniref:DUF4293 family protein n=1 Tax=Aequorivita antarctica TaxID=153266 RepID=A0A5C6YZT7_9FLAO|nr:DUF6326 family protein [Aequorivita antarctica]TXD73283.1 hypothetical protein ESU54_09095 [Aequorivita antarctica]SRX76037.1 hypothetical protein AEQU3_03035 [Aequorivita antarctica]